MTWVETPRNAALVLGVVVIVVSAFCGWLGWSIGQTPPNPIVIQLVQPPAGH
jgi:hypothetical protein